MLLAHAEEVRQLASGLLVDHFHARVATPSAWHGNAIHDSGHPVGAAYSELISGASWRLLHQRNGLEEG
jgi:hypothetical protein